MELDRSNQKCDVLDYMSSSGSRDIGRFSVLNSSLPSPKRLQCAQSLSRSSLTCSSFNSNMP